MLLARTKKEAYIYIIIISLAFSVNFYTFAFPDDLATQAFAGIACFVSADILYMLYHQIRRNIII